MNERILSAAASRFYSPLAPFVAILVAALGATTTTQAQTNNYFGTNGTLNGSVWSTNPAGPYNAALDTTGGALINFDNPTGTPVTGASIAVAGINATANTTLTGTSGTITNLSNAVIPINVASGVTLDFSTQPFTTSGTAGYNFTGPGVLALAGGAYGGGFTINSGTVILRGVNAMGGAAGNTLTINGGTIAASGDRNLSGKYDGGITVGGNFTLGATTGLATSAATLTFNNTMSLGAATRTITIGGNGVYTLGGVISGATGTGLVVDATAGGRLTLTALNSYDGGTTIKSGILADGNATSGHTDTFGSGPITLGDTTGNKDATIYGFVASSTANEFSGDLTVAAGSSGNTLAIAGFNTEMLFTGSVALNNSLTLANGNLGKRITLSGQITQISDGTAITITNGATITGTAATAATTGQALLSGGVVIGTGGLTLANNAGQLFTVGTGNITSTTTGNLTLNANSTGNFTVSATSINHTGSITNSGSSNGTTTIGGTIGSNVTGLIQNSATSNMVLTVANPAFTGGTTVTAGILNLRNANSLQNSVVNMNGGSLRFGSGAFPSVALGGLVGSGNVNLNDTQGTPAAVALTIGNSNGQNATYSGGLSNTNGNATLTKAGSNTQTLSGNNTYTGATLITAGTLIVDGSLTSAVTVNAGTFGGSGSTTGNVTVGNSAGGHDAFIAPGSSAGNFTTTGSLSLLSDATYAFELNGTTGIADKLVANGVSLNSSAVFSFTLLGGTSGLAVNDTFTIIDNTSGGNISGEFSNLTAGGTFDAGGGLTFAVSGSPGVYGNDLILTLETIPEPQTWALLTLSLTTAMVLRRRRIS